MGTYHGHGPIRERRGVRCTEVRLGWLWKHESGTYVKFTAVDATDLAEWLVVTGLAIDWPRYSAGHYNAAQREAERAARGIWAGSYVEPWLYRTCIRAGGRPAGCSDDSKLHP
jgi:endonuclease YncB( thermonuclease family)